MYTPDAILAYREGIIESTRALIRIPSVKQSPQYGAPFGRPCADALDAALAIARGLGLETKNVDGYAGHAEYGEGDECIGVLGHLDVVPEGDAWTTPPFGGDVKDGFIYGRGAVDNKGPCVVSLYCLKAIKDLGLPLKRRVRVILGTDEESGWQDMDYYFAREPLPRYGFSPDAGYPMYNREKGILHLLFESAGRNGTAILSLKGGAARNMVPDACTARVNLSGVPDADAFLAGLDGGRVTLTARDGHTVTLLARGVSAHGASPQSGENAVAYMLDALEPLYKEDASPIAQFLRFAHERIGHECDGASLGAACEDEPSGPLTLNMGFMDMDGERAALAADIRFPVTHVMERIVKDAEAAAGAHGVRVSVEKYTAPLYVPEHSPLIQTLSRVYKDVTGLTGECLSMGGGTYARVLKNNGVAFGPGFPGGRHSGAHQPDERADIDELMRHARVCFAAMAELANI